MINSIRFFLLWALLLSLSGCGSSPSSSNGPLMVSGYPAYLTPASDRALVEGKNQHVDLARLYQNKDGVDAHGYAAQIVGTTSFATLVDAFRVEFEAQIKSDNLNTKRHHSKFNKLAPQVGTWMHRAIEADHPPKGAISTLSYGRYGDSHLSYHHEGVWRVLYLAANKARAVAEGRTWDPAESSLNNRHAVFSEQGCLRWSYRDFLLSLKGVQKFRSTKFKVGPTIWGRERCIALIEAVPELSSYFAEEIGKLNAGYMNEEVKSWAK